MTALYPRPRLSPLLFGAMQTAHSVGGDALWLLVSSSRAVRRNCPFGLAGHGRRYATLANRVAHGGEHRSMNDHVLVEVDPESSRFAKGSEQWLRERESLRSDLERELGPGIVQQSSLEQGDKGLPLVPLVVALGGAHAFQALARCFESWLKYRPGERSLTMTAVVNGKTTSVQINVSNASVDALQPFIQALGDALK
jgi:Effector Associated Constant Component 1